MARPLREINWDQVEKLMEAGCTAKQIYTKYRVHRDTFYDRFKSNFEMSFADYSAWACSSGEADLMLMQHAKALNSKASGNVQMLIHLGKVRLGQREPDAVSAVAPRQDDLNKDHTIMQLEHLVANLKEQLANGNKPETE